MREHIRQVKDFLESAGARDIYIARLTKHLQARWTWNGKAMAYTLPYSPSDFRGTRNAISCIRRMMGLVKTTKTIGERREKKHKPKQQPKIAESNYDDWRKWRQKEDAVRFQVGNKR